jgi:hypothetical protein
MTYLYNLPTLPTYSTYTILHTYTISIHCLPTLPAVATYAICKYYIPTTAPNTIYLQYLPYLPSLLTCVHYVPKLPTCLHYVPTLLLYTSYLHYLPNYTYTTFLHFLPTLPTYTTVGVCCTSNLHRHSAPKAAHSPCRAYYWLATSSDTTV